MKRMILLAAGLAMVLSAAAQTGGDGQQRPERPQMKERPTVEQEAQALTDQMAAELELTDKQVKQVFNYFKSDIKYRRENFEFSGPRPDGDFPSPPSGDFPGRGGFPSGGPGGPGGMRPSGPPPSGGPGGMRPGNPPSGRPPFAQEIDYEALEKYNAKQDKKLRKIIGDENFEKWSAAHPQEVPKLPELEIQQ